MGIAYVLRTAWPSEASILSTRSCSSRQTFPSGKAIATEWIEIDDVEYRTYLLTAGLPFHHRVEERFMETLLGNGSTGQLRRKIGIGIDLPNASIAALQFGQPAHAVPLQSAANAPTAAGAATWLMHVDAKNVLMQLYAPLMDEAGNCAAFASTCQS